MYQFLRATSIVLLLGSYGLLPSNSNTLALETKPSLASSAPRATAKRVALAGGRVSFVPPPGFTALTLEEISTKFPGVNPPQHVYGNDSRSVSVAFTSPEEQLRPEQLPEFKTFMESFLQQIVPGLEWVTQSFVVISNTRWARLEFISQAVDTKIHNDMYLTSFEGRLLGFNLNTTVEQYAGAKAELLKCRDSISIEP